MKVALTYSGASTATSYWWMAIINENKLGVEHPRTINVKKYLKNLHEKMNLTKIPSVKFKIVKVSKNFKTKGYMPI